METEGSVFLERFENGVRSEKEYNCNKSREDDSFGDILWREFFMNGEESDNYRKY